MTTVSLNSGWRELWVYYESASSVGSLSRLILFLYEPLVTYFYRLISSGRPLPGSILDGIVQKQNIFRNMLPKVSIISV